MTVLYGIKNCDTVKKARRWLDENGIDYRFHDLRADGLDPQTVNQWLDALGTDTLLNKRSTTWTQLSDADKTRAQTGDAASLILDNPTLVKRPVLVAGETLRCGFKDADYVAIFR